MIILFFIFLESKKVKGVFPTMTPFDLDEEANDLIAISSVSTACVVAVSFSCFGS